jgi:glycosyltransferase involved in cell wall biosynthesis
MHGLLEISVINLCFNTGSRVISTLESIASQTFRGFEILIVDDGSTDNSLQVINDWVEKHPELSITIIENKINKGIPKSLNRALAIAKGRYVSIIGDDTWHEKFLELTWRALKDSASTTGMIFTACKCFDKDENKYLDDLNPMEMLNKINYPFKNNFFEQVSDDVHFIQKQKAIDALFWTNYIIAFSFLVKRSVIDKLGGFSEDYPIEDYPFWMKVTTHFDLLFLNQNLATYIRYHSNFTSNRSVILELTVANLLAKNLRYVSHSDTLYMIQHRINSSITTLPKKILLSNSKKDIKLYLSTIYNLAKNPLYKFRRAAVINGFALIKKAAISSFSLNGKKA